MENLATRPIREEEPSAFAFDSSDDRRDPLDALAELGELDVFYDNSCDTLWTYMRPEGRPSFTPSMLEDFVSWQALIDEAFSNERQPLRYLVLGSRSQGVFCFGGDLDLFAKLITAGDRDGLVRYGHRCVEILFGNLHSLRLPILTIGLVEGAALGGGFEALLSFDHVIAERSATFGLPEIMFGLFPGMGAHALLSRKIGSAAADRLISSSKTYSAEEMHALGLVHELADDGQGLDATRAFIRRSSRKHQGLVASRKAMKRSWNLDLDELFEITEIWADAALQLGPQDLKLMNRLVSAQTRHAAGHA